MEYVTVRTCLNLAEAELIRGELESAGISVNMKNDDALMGTEGGVLVQVMEDKVDEAQALLKYQAPPS